MRGNLMAYTLLDHSRDYALSLHAPDGVADAYADYVFAEDAEGAYGELGANHATEWPAWSERNLSTCPECGSPWGLLCADGWECQSCPFDWDEE
jgi:hypothetical protein